MAELKVSVGMVAGACGVAATRGPSRPWSVVTG